MAMANLDVLPQGLSPKRVDGVDFVLALASGPNAWTTPDSASTPMVRAGLVSGLASGVATASVLTALILVRHEGQAILPQVGLVSVAIAAVFTMSSSSLAAMRRQQNRGGRRSVLALRVLALVVFSTIWIGTVPPLLSPLIWLFGVFGGVEAALTASLIGHDPRFGQLFGHFLLSPIHLGVVCGGLAMSLLGGDWAVDRMVITALGSLEVAAASSIVTFEMFRRLLSQEGEDRAAIQRSVRAAESQRRAHWIHDDVCADIRELRVKMAAMHLDHEQVSQELDQLDDRLRERQLDEMVDGGAIAAAEILQSSVRRAQSAGVVIARVPRFEEASILLEAEAARLLRRCTSGFVANALNAGATVLGFELAHTETEVVVTVSDNAGGFDLRSAPAGRGLASLVGELGPGRLISERVDGGTAMTAHIRLGGSS